MTVKKRTLITFVRYCGTCGLVLGAKLVFTYVAMLFASPMLAYAIAHILIFFVSYELHSRLTFKTEKNLHSLYSYLIAVIGFKILDYLIFSLLFQVYKVQALTAVLAATLIITVLRFLTVRSLVFEKGEGAGEPGEINTQKQH